MDSEQRWASIDHFRMEQVFRNLFENSLAACSGSARITVHSEELCEQTGTLRVTVSDNGTGFENGSTVDGFPAFFYDQEPRDGPGLVDCSSHRGSARRYDHSPKWRSPRGDL